MNPILKKLMCFQAVRDAYEAYLAKREIQLEGKYLLAGALQFRKKYEQLDQRDISPFEMQGVHAYNGYYALHVLEKTDEMPESQETVGREFVNISVNYDDIAVDNPEFTVWQFQHYRLKANLPTYEGLTVEETIRNAGLMLNMARMGIVAESFYEIKGRLPDWRDRAEFTLEDGPVICYRDFPMRPRRLQLKPVKERE